MNTPYTKFVGMAVGLLAMVLVLFSFTRKEKAPFSFVQICDTQLGFGEYNRDIGNFKQAVKQINALKADFVVICGDLVNTASDSAYRDFLTVRSLFTMPCHLAPGNHDVSNNPTDSTLLYYRKTIGEDYFKFDHKGYSFLVVNTQLWKAPMVGETEKFEDWLLTTLTSRQDRKKEKFVIGHIPLYVEDPGEEEGYFSIAPEKRKEILQLFTENKVRAYLSGHTHKLVINQYKDIQLVSVETTSKNFDKRPFGYRVWTVSEDGAKHVFVPLD